MRKNPLLYSILLLIPLAFWAGFKCGSSQDDYLMPPPHFNIMEIVSQNQKDTCYLISEVWGLGQDHYQTVVTKKKPPKGNLLWRPNPAEDYIWKGTDNGIFYKKTGDTIQVFSLSAPSKPKTFHSQFEILSETIDNAQFIDLQNKVDTTMRSFQ